MESFENDELSDRELDSMLRAWDAPEAPARLRAAVFPKTRRPWWTEVWRASFRVPVPVALVFGAIMVFVVWRAMTLAPRIEVARSHELRPVTELRPIIIRSQHAQN
jgi:hypothetical protein